MDLIIFQQEIAAEINLEAEEKRKELEGNLIEKEQIEDLKSQKEKLDAQHQDLHAQWVETQRLIDCEVKGTCGTGQDGMGPRYRELLRVADQLKQEKEKKGAEIDEINKQIRAKQEQLDQKIEAITIEQKGISSLANQLDILMALGEENKNIAHINHAITLLFIMLEVSPVLVKLMSPYGPYDAALDSIDEINKLEQKENQEIHRQICQKKRQKLIEFYSDQWTNLLAQSSNHPKCQAMNERLIEQIINITEQQLNKEFQTISNIEYDSNSVQEIQKDIYEQKKAEKVKTQKTA